MDMRKRQQLGKEAWAGEGNGRCQGAGTKAWNLDETTKEARAATRRDQDQANRRDSGFLPSRSQSDYTTIPRKSPTECLAVKGLKE